MAIMGVRIGVDRHDQVGATQPGGVLHGTGNAQRQISIGVDHHAGGPNLTFVTQRALVGDHPGGTHRCSEQPGHLGEQPKLGGAAQPGAATQDALRLGQIHGGRAGRVNRHQLGRLRTLSGRPDDGSGQVVADGVGTRGCGDGPHARGHRGHKRSRWRGGQLRPAAVPVLHHPVRPNRDRTGVKRTAKHQRQVRGQVTAVGGGGGQHDLGGAQQVGHSRCDRMRRPSPRPLQRPHLCRQGAQRRNRLVQAIAHHDGGPVRLGDALERSRRQLATTYREDRNRASGSVGHSTTRPRSSTPARNSACRTLTVSSTSASPLGASPIVPS